MYNNYVFRNVDEALPALLWELNAAPTHESRNGETKELTHVGITLTHPLEREITIKGRKANLAAQIVETMWVMSGRDDIEFLENYLPRASDFSDDGKVWRGAYGPRLRDWNGLDQVQHVVNLLKEDPNSRRAVIQIYDPARDNEPGKDIPCNNTIHFSLRNNRLDMHVFIRSNDIIWGWSGINAFEWSFLLEIVARCLRTDVGSLHFSTTSLHIYEPHFKRAREIIAAKDAGSQSTTYPHFRAIDLKDFDDLATQWFVVERQIRIDAPNVEYAIEAFPDDLLREWLRVIHTWWGGGNVSYTRSQRALQVGMKRKTEESSYKPSAFIDYVIALHEEKAAGYGESWKKRGEMFSILPNIARKIDRLGGAETSDETSTDTAIDLFVYLCKYAVFLVEKNGWNAETKSDGTHWANEAFKETEQTVLKENEPVVISFLENHLRKTFDLLLADVEVGNLQQVILDRVVEMAEDAYRVARTRWDDDQSGDDYKGADID